MRYKKFLITSVSLISAFSSYAACSGNDCFNQGVDFGNQAKPSASVISNSTLESAVGSNNISQANAMQDSIQQTMGGNYKNIDGITNAGNNKAQACVGKDTAECKAYNYYNDPLTRLSQQGVESAVGVASKLINKKIEQNVDLASYCSSHPNDTTCKMCRDDPSQAMCQQGNKCTTISYTTGDNKYVTNGCQIIGQRSYECDKWVDNVIFHNNYIPPNPPDGTSTSFTVNLSGRYRMVQTKTCSASFKLTFIFYDVNSKMNKVTVTGADGDKTNSSLIDYQSSNVNVLYYSNAYSQGSRTGDYTIASHSCNSSTCYVKLKSNLREVAYMKQSGGTVQDTCTASSENDFTYVRPTPSSNTRIVDQVVWKDNCSR